MLGLSATQVSVRLEAHREAHSCAGGRYRKSPNYPLLCAKTWNFRRSGHFHHILTRRCVCPQDMHGWKATSPSTRKTATTSGPYVSRLSPAMSAVLTSNPQVPLGLVESRLAYILWPWKRFGPLGAPLVRRHDAPIGSPDWRRGKAELERAQWRSSRVTVAPPPIEPPATVGT